MRPATNRRSEGRPVLRILKRRALYLLIPILLLTPAAAFYAGMLPRAFRAKALVGAESPLPGLPTLGARVDPSAVNAQEQLRAIQETLLTPGALRTVAREFDLNGVESPLGANKWLPWRYLLEHYRTQLQFLHLDQRLRAWAGLAQTPPTLDQAAENLKSSIQIQIESPTTFYLGYESASADLAAQVSNRLAAIFVERTSTIHSEIVERQDSVLDAEVERTRNRLMAAEDALKAYKERVAQQVPERFASNVKQLDDLQQQIQARTDKITESESRRASILEELSALEKQGVLRKEPPPKTSTQLALEEKRAKLNQLKTRYTSEYPEIVTLDREIRALEAFPAPAASQIPVQPPSEAQLRYYALKSELTAIEPRLASYRSERQALLARMPDYERRIDSSPGNEATISEQTKDAAMLRGRYEALFAKQQEQRLNQRTEKTSAVSIYKILEPAQIPAAPYSPHLDRIVLFSLLAALAFGIGGVVLAEQFDSTFETAEEVENFAQLPVLTAIPRVSARLTRSAKPPAKPNSRAWQIETASLHPFSPIQMREFQRHRMPVLSDPQSVAAQQFGILALKVERRMRESDKQILVIASATGEEGKSVTALNISLALAESLPGQVLLVDCDLRLPQMHRRLGLSQEPGLGDLLRNESADFSPYIAKVGDLDVIPGGVAPANPAALFASARTRRILDRFRQEYDLVVLDCPPLIPVADSQVLADAADAVLLVVRARRTRSDLFLRAKQNLDDGKLLGVVLNDAEYAGTPYAYAYRHYQKHYLRRSSHR